MSDGTFHIVRQTDRAFGLTFAGIFTVFFTVGWFFFDVRHDWLLVATACFLIVALVCPGVLLPLNRLWGYLAGRLSRVSNYALLGTLLYLLITPMGLVMRAFGWDAMTRRLTREGTYWSPVQRDTDASTLNDMF